MSAADDVTDGDATGSVDDHVAAVADAADGAVDEHPWLEEMARLGWISRGVIYTLMGLTAFQIARQDPTSKDASPEGSIGRVGEAPFGRILLVVLAIGLLLHVLWRLLELVSMRGTDMSDWATRAGYALSAGFSLVIAWVAGHAAVNGVDPEGSNSVETWSRRVLETTGGRWLLGVAGLVTIGVGVAFVVQQGIRRGFVDDLDGVDEQVSRNRSGRSVVVIAGVVGWIGRGTVTALVGFFVVRAALTFDPDDARGFDRSLRETAGSTMGSILVTACAIGLICYGVFCLVSHRYRSLDDRK